jgi:hypothetical protein
MTKSTIIFLQGGLGNQLFQYAAGLTLAEYNKSKLYLTPSEYNKHSGRDYRQKIYIRSIPINTNQTNYIEHPDPFQSWCPDNYINIDHIKIKGYFQYLPAIESQIPIIKNDILNIFLNIREELIKKYKIINKKDLYFIHVRRNDYLVQPENTLYIQDKTYYLNSLDKIDKFNKRWFVLSDDINWCQEQEWLSQFEIVDEPDELYGLMLMSLCEGGAIIANSTYSWWGAMLGCGKDNSSVYYPIKWFGNKRINMFPDNWNSI